jgi:pSer/pThr/pTyr-binding forkhead associated (FHA) protein
MPLIRCPKCGQAYDIPGVIAVRLPNSIATCHCGEWLAGSKAAVLARMLNPQEIKEVDLQPYRVERPAEQEPSALADAFEEPFTPRSVRVITSGVAQPLNTIFTIYEYPLLVGRKGCHVEIEGAELSIRHCSISLKGSQLIVRDFDSHMGTFLDGQQIDEAVLEDGVHLIRAGSAIISVEPVNELGRTVEPIHLDAAELVDESVLARTVQARRESANPPGTRVVLICVEGALSGQEFEVPPTGLVVGREGHVRVPDEFLSRRHFEVLPDAEGIIRVRDLGSRNGTFLNTLPARDTKVQVGDEIRAGVNRFKIEYRQ